MTSAILRTTEPTKEQVLHFKYYSLAVAAVIAYISRLVSQAVHLS